METDVRYIANVLPRDLYT